MTVHTVNPAHADTAVATLKAMGLSAGPRITHWLAADETVLLDLHIGRTQVRLELVDTENGRRDVWATAYAKHTDTGLDIQGALDELERLAADFVPLDSDTASS